MQSALDFVILRQKHVIFRYKASQSVHRSSVHIPLQVKTADRNHISARLLEALSSRVDSKLVRGLKDCSFSTATDMHDLRFPATPITVDMESFACSATHRSALLFILPPLMSKFFPHVGNWQWLAWIPTVHPAHHRTLTKAGIRNRQNAPHGECLLSSNEATHTDTFPQACTRASIITNTITSKPNLHRPEVKYVQTSAPALSKVSHSWSFNKPA